MRWFALKADRHHKKGKFHLCEHKTNRVYFYVGGWQPICGEPLTFQPDNLHTIERKRPNMIERCSKCERKRKAIK